MFLPPGSGRAAFTWEFCLLLLERKSQWTLLASTVFQVPLTQNNQHAEVAHIGVACPKRLHFLHLALP